MQKERVVDKEFIIDLDKKKELIKRRIKNSTPAVRWKLAICKALKGIILAAMIVMECLLLASCVYLLLQGDLAEMAVVLVACFLVAVVALVLLAIPFAVTMSTYAKELKPTAFYNSRDEKVIIYSGTIEHAYYLVKGSGNYFTRTMQISNIRRLEYDREAGFLKIYGDTVDKEWDRFQRSKSLSTTKSSYDHGAYLTINSLFPRL